MLKWVLAALCSSLVGSLGCGKSNPTLPDGGEVDAGPPDAGPGLATTYRIISGVSMGAIGASTMGLHHPELFDGVAALGGPLDARYLLRVIEKQHLGGFCTLAELETQLARDPAGLNDPSVMTCMHQVPGTVETEHTQSFSHWRFTSSGGHFTRSSYLDLFADLSLSFGNPVSYNPDSPFAPQGVPASWALRPPADSCTHPYVIKGKLSDPSGTPIYNKEYNPDGKYDAISFCDGEESPIYFCVATKQVVNFCAHGAATPVPKAQEAAYATAFCQAQNSAVDQATDDDTVSDEVLAIYNAEQGRYDPCREHFEPIRVGLAYDLNGNGRRDFAEPVSVNNHERYQDIGKDGCTDELEDGHGGCVTDPSKSPHQSGVADPNGDNYDPKTNPLGTEGNWAHDDGEPYEDFGLDGVANTHDYGEGDGKFNLSPNLDRFMAYDPVGNFNKLTAEQKRLIDIYLDGGRIDVFNFGVAADLFGKAIAFAMPGQQSAFTGFAQLPNRDPLTGSLSLDENADGTKVTWDKVARNVSLVYGTEHPSAKQARDGDGDHVGTARQAVDRFQFMESWVANRWPHLPLTGRPADPVDYNDRQLDQTYFSTVLGATRSFSIFLPPGYHNTADNPRYPVLYLLHGYGMNAKDFAASSVAVFEPPMSRYESGFPAINGTKYIVVFVSGRGCWTNAATGEKDCTLVHEDAPGWQSAVTSGNFYVNSAGLDNNGGDRYEDSFVELVHYVDEHFHTLPGAVVQAR